MRIDYKSFGNAEIASTDGDIYLVLVPGAEYDLERGHNYVIRTTVQGLKLKLQIHSTPAKPLFLHKFTLTSSRNADGMDRRNAHAIILSALRNVVEQLSEGTADS